MTKTLRCFGGSMLCMAAGLAHAQNAYTLQEPQTPIAREIYALHDHVLLIGVGICVVVFAALLYSIVRYRRSRGHEPARFTDNKALAIAWTLIPVLILVAIAFPATRAVFAMKDTSHPDITIKITGYQWKWRYDYLREDIGFYSSLSTPQDQIDNRAPKGANYLLEVDNPLVVPVGKKIRILLTADDVIHSWWVPAFGVKQDGIPGFVRDSWFKVEKPGVYRGQCAELCGMDHGFMPVVVNALPEKEYLAWVADQKASQHASAAADAAAADKVYTLEELKAEGEKVYTKNCMACHQANGQGMPPAFPALAHGKIATGPLAGAVGIVVNGSAKNPAMVAWKSQLSDVELASVITYVRNSFGNQAADLVQPKDVAAARH
jgi:cytochrome c oxidase subunit II